MTNTKAILIGVDRPHDTLPIADSLQELAQLADTAGITVVGRVTQKRDYSDPATYLGSGKLNDLIPHLQDTGASIIIADDELKPRQQRNLQQVLQCKILDRTSLILDIFASRAHTHEAKIQVELAQLTYLATRLTRLWTHLSRLGGGVGTRGPGEKQLEVDKRLSRNRIKQLKTQLEAVRKNRMIHRLARDKRPHLVGALIGYTNAGKSTLFNSLTDSDIPVLAADQLFATLDPTTRRMTLDNAPPVLITDTVGFIQKLPTLLIDAFQATIESIYDADFFIHVIDSAASPDTQAVHIQTTQHLLRNSPHPVFYVFNKCDLIKTVSPADLYTQYTPNRVMSAMTLSDSQALKQDLQVFIQQFETVRTVLIPYSQDHIRHQLHQHGHVLNETATEDGVTLTVRIQSVIGEKIIGKLNKL